MGSEEVIREPEGIGGSRLARPPAETAIDPIPVANPVRMTQACDISEIVLLGDEAVALGAVHAGLTAAYGTGQPVDRDPRYLIRHYGKARRSEGRCARTRKTAYEAALRRSYAAGDAGEDKHVGLTVAADPFMKSAS